MGQGTRAHKRAGNGAYGRSGNSQSCRAEFVAKNLQKFLQKLSYLYENKRETRVVTTRGSSRYHVLYILRRASSLVRTVR